jgi:excinuclease ABC subunit A
MTVDEAAVFFSSIPSIYPKLKVLSDVGLGYVNLVSLQPRFQVERRKG